MSDSVRPHPWDSPGKNTGVGCHFLLQCIKVKSESEVAQSRLTLRGTCLIVYPVTKDGASLGGSAKCPGFPNFRGIAWCGQEIVQVLGGAV